MMDGVHDLGGRQGFGPVRWQEDIDDEAFHEPWEARAWALFVWGWRAGDPSWSIDWFRHTRELIEPTDYLTRPYFDQWVQTLAAMAVDQNLVSLEELRTGKSTFVPEFTSKASLGNSGPPALDSWSDPYAVDMDAGPKFKPGDTVRAKTMAEARHTRLPGYVRGRTGIIREHHGGQIFADDSARGVNRGDHLYTVAFEASELWPEAAGSKDQVFVDMWESYLERE